MDQEEHPCDGLSRDRQWFTTCWPAQGAELVSWYQQQQNRAYYFFGMRTWTQNHMLASELYPQPKQWIPMVINVSVSWPSYREPTQLVQPYFWLFSVVYEATPEEKFKPVAVGGVQQSEQDCPTCQRSERLGVGQGLDPSFPFLAATPLASGPSQLWGLPGLQSEMTDKGFFSQGLVRSLWVSRELWLTQALPRATELSFPHSVLSTNSPVTEDHLWGTLIVGRAQRLWVTGTARGSVG